MNARPNVADVVMIITDGEPRGPGPQGREEQNAYDNADALKNKAILVDGVAVGPQRLAFKTKIERMATSSSNTFDAEFDKLDTIMKNLVDASCQPFKPGKV